MKNFQKNKNFNMKKYEKILMIFIERYGKKKQTNDITIRIIYEKFLKTLNLKIEKIPRSMLDSYHIV
jgi:hypothetical protein